MVFLGAHIQNRNKSGALQLTIKVLTHNPPGSELTKARLMIFTCGLRFNLSDAKSSSVSGLASESASAAACLSFSVIASKRAQTPSGVLSRVFFMVFALFPGFSASSRDYARSAVSKRVDDGKDSFVAACSGIRRLRTQ